MIVSPVANLFVLLLGNNSPHTPLHQFGAPSYSSSSKIYYEWNLPNGNVQFERPQPFGGIKAHQKDGATILESDDSSSISLWDPKFLGRYVNDETMHEIAHTISLQGII